MTTSEQAVKAAMRIIALEQENSELRYMLFLRHGGFGHTLYGDDGEMQCGTCGVDFKRMTATEIAARFLNIGMRQLQAAIDEAEKPKPPCETCGGTGEVSEDWDEKEQMFRKCGVCPCQGKETT